MKTYIIKRLIQAVGVCVPEQPGLGVEVNQKALDGYTIAREVIRI